MFNAPFNEDLQMRNLIALASGLMFASMAMAEPVGPTPPPATRDSEIKRGYSFCGEGSFKSVEACVKAAEEENKKKPSDAFLFGVIIELGNKQRVG